MKINQISYVIFQTTTRCFFKYCSSFNVMTNNSSAIFLAQLLYTLDKRSPSKWKFSDFWLLAWKLTKLDKRNPSKCKSSHFRLLAWKLTKLLVIFQASSQFSFKFRITLHCHDTWFLWHFLAEILYALDKKIPSKYNFLDFRVL